MDIAAQIAAFLQTPAGTAIKALLVGTILVFVLGAIAALRDGTFKLTYIDSFVRSTIWGRVAPVTVVLVVGYLFDEPTATGAGIIAATAVGVGLIGAALDSIRQLTIPKVDSAIVNTPPTA